MGEGGEVLDMSESVFAEALADYPGMELAWLQLLYEAQQAEAGSAPAPRQPAVLRPAVTGFRTKARTRGLCPGPTECLQSS